MVAIGRSFSPLATPAILGGFLLILIAVVPTASAAKGQCIWYGVCKNKTDTTTKYCSYNGPAKPIEGGAKALMQQYCPEIASTGMSCCSHEQLQVMASNVALIRNLFKSCPTCVDNFMKHICGMTCSPDQADFIKPVHFEQFNATHQRVTEIDYHLSETYKNTTYYSCAHIIISTGEQGQIAAIDLTCGEWGLKYCSPQRWFDFMGDSTIPYVPFQINYVGNNTLVDGYTPYNPETRPCNQSSTPVEDILSQVKRIPEYDYESESLPSTPQTPKDKQNNLDTTTILPKEGSKKLDGFNTTTAPPKKDSKDSQCCFTCDIAVQEKKLQIEEDYYNHKKEYFKEKLRLMKQQVDAFKLIARNLGR